MSHLNKSNIEMVFHVSSSISFTNRNIIPQDLTNNNNTLTRASNNSLDSTILATNNMEKGQHRSQLLPTNFDHENNDEDDDNKKKIIHREIEKQRRREMAALHAGLRSLIPLEYIKGKRSMSDHMNGATNYIKSLQARIAELSVKRDDLRRSNLRATESTYCTPSSCTVTVYPCLAGVEIALSSAHSSSGGREVFRLSRVLQLLLGQGLTLVGCVSTKVSDQRSLHNIQAEVKDATCFNLAQLQQTLNETILSWNESSSS